MSDSTITFATTRRDFTKTLNMRVNEYFKSTHKSRYANSQMILKSVIMFLLYFAPYFLIVGNVVVQIHWIILLLILMSFGAAGIGLSVMHDANHGAYSMKKWVNNMMGYSLNLLGAHAFNWKIQHNVLHHTYTNIYDHDEDISPRGVLRFSPHSEWKKFHRYQYMYAWFLYGLMTIVWVINKDFARLVKYNKNGLVQKVNAKIHVEWIILIATKLFYIGYIFIIPLIFTALTWWQILLGIIIMQYIMGIILAVIFQPAHVNEETNFPEPDEQNAIHDNWAVHQLYTTANFSNNSRLFSWYIGALNFQVEHHLFPNICHVHYNKISEVIKATTKEFGLPYKKYKTFFGALRSHYRMLKRLSTDPQLK